MKKLSLGFFVFTILALIGATVFRMFVIKIRPYEIGVKTREFGFLGAGKGVVAKDFDQPGWYVSLPVVHRWYRFNKRVQSLRMTYSPKSQKNVRGAGNARRPIYGPEPGQKHQLQVKTKDGYDVNVSVRVKFRIKPGQAHNLPSDVGTNEGTYLKIVENETTDACRIEFGEMSTEQFYDPHARARAAEEIQTLLQRKLDSRHLEIVDILISGVGFGDRYEEKIKQKKLQDQDVEVARSRAKLEEILGERRKVEAQTEAKLQEIQADTGRMIEELTGTNEVRITEIIEDAKKFESKTLADADLLLKSAEATRTLRIEEAKAQGEKAKVQALTGPGGRALVALEAAKNLRIQKADFSTLGTDLLDLEAMSQKLGMGN